MILLIKKPIDWVDDETIADPDATKPSDWDEDAPKYIPDPEASKPSDWDENEPEQIPNPDYKGKWVPPRIANPAFKGKWKAKQIENPKFFEDFHPHNFAPMGGIGIELWTMTNKITFDNIFIGESLEEAFEFAEATWKVKYDVEKQLEEKEKATKDSPDYFQITLKFVKDNVIIISIVSFVVLLLSLLLCALCGEKKETKEKKVKKEEKKEEEGSEDSEEEGEEKTETIKEDNKTNIRKRNVTKDK